jgi:plastocyanin
MCKAMLLRALLVTAAGVLALALAAPAGTAGPAGRTGTLTGTVRFEGKPPARAELDRSRDPYCAATRALSEEVVVADGRLRDVHVRLPGGVAGEHPAPKSAVVIDQRGCAYRPRVVGLIEGQTVNVTNGDQTFHNVRGTRDGKTRFNHAQPSGAKEIVESNLGKAGEVITFRCDVHPWMRAFAVVTDHPFFAVTGDDGSFTITGVPIGTYSLEAWHPTLGLVERKVTVEAGKSAEVTFSFRAK